MDISTTQMTSLASASAATDPTSIKVLKKAMDIQKQTAMQLIEAIPPAPTANSGQNVNIKV